MDTHQITFAITGMCCTNCAIAIEQALTRLDGIMTARVDYATQSAAVMFVPAQESVAAMVGAVRSTGCDVVLERIELHVDDLLYATSAQTVERVLSHLDGVVQVHANLSTQLVVLDVFPKHVNPADCEREIANLGLYVAERSTTNAARAFVARTIIVSGLAVLGLLSAGAHVSFFDAGTLHSPLIVIVISVLVAFGVGWRFHRPAYDTFLHGERDCGIVVTFIILILLFGGTALAMIASTAWFSVSGLVFATLLTAGRYLTRSAALWVLPHFQYTAFGRVHAAQT